MLEPLRKPIDCPNCGAPGQLSFPGSVQAVCRYCRTLLVRTDAAVETHGQVAEVLADASPIRLGVRGAHKGQGFIVVGRIVYEHDAGGWNEWHLGYADGSSGWLSDAQLQYAVTRAHDAGRPLPGADGVAVGQRHTLAGVEFRVVSITRARYAGIEGELPFRAWDREICTFADLRTADRKFATIDYGDDAPALYVGESVDYAALRLQLVREFEGW